MEAMLPRFFLAKALIGRDDGRYLFFAEGWGGLVLILVLREVENG